MIENHKLNFDQKHNFQKFLHIYAEFECTSCKKKFSTKAYLQTHQKSHDEEEPNKCEICDKPYKSVNNFKKHMLAKHAV